MICKSKCQEKCKYKPVSEFVILKRFYKSSHNIIIFSRNRLHLFLSVQVQLSKLCEISNYDFTFHCCSHRCVFLSTIESFTKSNNKLGAPNRLGKNLPSHNRQTIPGLVATSFDSAGKQFYFGAFAPFEFFIGLLFSIIGLFYLAANQKKLGSFILILFVFTVLYSINYDTILIRTSLLAFVMLAFLRCFRRLKFLEMKSLQEYLRNDWINNCNCHSTIFQFYENAKAVLKFSKTYTKSAF